MAEETIVADELDVEETDNSESESDQEETDTEKELLKAELNRERAEKEKERAEKEKWESRYKSTMKKQSQKREEPIKETKETKTETQDLDSIVERKLYAIEEQREFIKTYGEDVFNEVKKIKDKHPTLSLNDAYKISPIASDQASKEEPSSMSMGGRANAAAFSDSKSISLEQLVKLDKAAYKIMKDRISKGEITLKK